MLASCDRLVTETRDAVRLDLHRRNYHFNGGLEITFFFLSSDSVANPVEASRMTILFSPTAGGSFSSMCVGGVHIQ
jgi:hypothetical protein